MALEALWEQQPGEAGAHPKLLGHRAMVQLGILLGLTGMAVGFWDIMGWAGGMEQEVGLKPGNHIKLC